jgi:hypothetical protein
MAPGTKRIRPRRRRPPAVGLTLVEMLVSITVLTVMILAFSTIMVQSQRFISLAQASRRSHALAASIGRVVRRDLRRASQNGFLAIAYDGGSPLMVLTAAGVSHSIAVEGDASLTAGTGSLICYGQVANHAQGHAGEMVLWRPEYILAGEAVTPSKDILNHSLAELQSNVQTTARTICDSVNGLRPNDISVPPVGLDQIDDLWQVLASGCEGLNITWTDGTVEPGTYNLNWYGMDENGQPHLCGDSTIEDPNATQYFALWTHEDQTNWPKAIKVRFRITDKNLPKNAAGLRAFDYDVICNLGP